MKVVPFVAEGGERLHNMQYTTKQRCTARHAVLKGVAFKVYSATFIGT